MTKKTGLKYEHDIAADLHDATDGEVRTYRCGWSGNTDRMPQPDVLVTTPTGNMALELKRTSQEQGFAIAEADVQQLFDCCNSYTDGYFGVKFNRRELALFGVPDVYTTDGLMASVCTMVPDELNPRLGHTSNSLLVDKPSLDSWQSASAGADDVCVLRDRMGLTEYQTPSHHAVGPTDESKVEA